MSPSVHVDIAPAEVAAAVERALSDFLLSRRSPAMPHPDRVYASSWRVCERRMVLELTVPEQQRPLDAYTLAKFRRGDDRERDILADLQQVGRNADPPFRVVGQQERFALRDRRGRNVITGKVDGQIQLERRDWRAPMEVKAWSPMITDRIDTFEDLFESPWTRSGAFQLLSYMYGFSLPYGFLVLDRSGLPKLLPVALDDHYDRVEEFLSRAERVVDHATAGTLPPFHDDPAECKRCTFFGSACQPPLSAPDIHVLTDPEFEAELHRRHELEPAASEFDSIDRRVKKRLRSMVEDSKQDLSAIAGAFAISGKWGKYSRLELPEDLKKKHTVSDPKGRFVLEITRL